MDKQVFMGYPIFQIAKQAPWAAAIITLVGGLICAKVKGWL